MGRYRVDPPPSPNRRRRDMSSTTSRGNRRYFFSGQFPAIEFNWSLARKIASGQSPTRASAVQSATEGFIHPGGWDIPRCSQEGREEDSAAVQSIEVLRLAQNQPTFTARFLSGQAGAVREPRICLQMQRNRATLPWRHTQNRRTCRPTVPRTA